MAATTLGTKGLVQSGLFFVGQVGGHNLELDALEGVRHLVHHRVAGHQEQDRLSRTANPPRTASPSYLFFKVPTISHF